MNGFTILQKHFINVKEITSNFSSTFRFEKFILFICYSHNYQFIKAQFTHFFPPSFQTKKKTKFNTNNSEAVYLTRFDILLVFALYGFLPLAENKIQNRRKKMFIEIHNTFDLITFKFNNERALEDFSIIK